MTLKTIYVKWVVISILAIFILFILYRIVGFTWNNKSIYSYKSQPIHDLGIEESKTKVVIDRFEDKYVICEQEDKTIINFKQNIIPIEAKVGDVLNIEGKFISIDIEETKKRKAEIEKLVKNLWK